MYALLCEQMLGRRPARVQLYYLSKPEAIIATPTEQSVTGVEAHAPTRCGRRSPGACDRDDFRPNPGRLCDYCTFKPYCPALRRRPGRGRWSCEGPGAVIVPSLPLAPAGAPA